MEEARKKLRICMVLVVAAAIIVGLIYYFHDVRGKDYATAVSYTHLWRLLS